MAIRNDRNIIGGMNSGCSTWRRKRRWCCNNKRTMVEVVELNVVPLGWAFLWRVHMTSYFTEDIFQSNCDWRTSTSFFGESRSWHNTWVDRLIDNRVIVDFVCCRDRTRGASFNVGNVCWPKRTITTKCTFCGISVSQSTLTHIYIYYFIQRGYGFVHKT